jgi:UvrB/uvrC motif.
MLKRLMLEIATEAVVPRARTPRTTLEQQLKEAVAREDYEQAAHLRDRLRKLPAAEEETDDHSI